ncbi:MAG: hypothetical protein ACRD29_03280 [Acidimicrobiales bacterium]
MTTIARGNPPPSPIPNYTTIPERPDNAMTTHSPWDCGSAASPTH